MYRSETVKLFFAHSAFQLQNIILKINIWFYVLPRPAEFITGYKLLF